MAKSKLTEEQLLLNDKEIIESINLDDERSYCSQGDELDTINVYPLLKAQIAKLRIFSYKSPDEIPAIERAAMERVTVAIGKWLDNFIISVGTRDEEHPFSRQFIRDLEEGKLPEALSELLGGGD